jgi:hypothetical protein
MEKKWFSIADKKYNSQREVEKEYQKVIKKTPMADIEQDWVDENLAPLMDFMGDENVWNAIIPGVHVQGAGGRASSRRLPITPYPIAVFSGAHWTSRKAGQINFFDPYDHYQIKGTNQFCQTFSMMYLVDSLPLPLPDGWDKNYEYAKNALEFIKEVIKNIPSNNPAFLEVPGLNKNALTKKVNECLKHSNICVNAIEFP